MSEQIGIGFIGCGGIHWPHHRGYLQIPEKAKIVACCDVVRAQAETSAEKAGGVPVYTDWKELLAQKDVDAVDICLPHHLHRPAIIDAARAGKHILCEKPLCLTLAEADEIAAEVRKAGITYMSAHNQLFHSPIVTARKLLAEGAIGKVYFVKTQDCFIAKGFAEGREKMGWRGDVAKQGGGELIDTGYHPSYMLLYLVGEPIEQVKAMTPRFRLPMDAEDTAFVLVRFANGVIGQIMTSWAMPNPAGSYTIHAIGSEGQLYGSHRDLYVLKHGEKEPEHQTFAEEKAGIEAEVEHFVDCIRYRTEPRATLQQGRDVLELILRAMEDGKR